MNTDSVLREETGVIAPESGAADADLAEAVAGALAWDLWVPDRRIRIAVHDRWVTLRGEVDSRFQEGAAVADVQRLPGVRGLTDLLTIRPTPPPGAVAQAVARALGAGAPAIRVDTFPGAVLLRGLVGSELERGRAERAARSVQGVDEVLNRLQVRTDAQ
jgi:osmotically-inducible protein OsmY